MATLFLVRLHIFTIKKVADDSITNIAIIIVLGMIFYYYEYYLRVIPSVMSLELKDAFNLGETQFGFLAACYYFAYTPMQIPVGMLVDRIGPRRILTFACFVCAASTYLFATTTHIMMAQISRIFVGFGSAFAYVGVLKLTNIWLPRKYFALMAGICSTLGMFGAISGQVIVNNMLKMVGWQSSLYYTAIVGFVITLLLYIGLKDENKLEKKQTSTKDIEEDLKLKSLTEMIYSQKIWLNGFIGCLTLLPITVLSEVWAINFLCIVGMSKEQAVLGSSMVFLGFAIGGPLWGWISDVIQSRRIPLIIGSFSSALLMALVIFIPTASIFLMYPLLFFTAFFASVEILVFAVSNDCTHHSVRGTAAAFTNMLTMLGGALIPPFVGKVLDSTNTLNLTIHHYSLALAILPVALMLSGILSFMLKE